MNKHVIRTPRTRCQCGNTNLTPITVYTSVDMDVVPMLYCSECYNTLTAEISVVVDKPIPVKNQIKNPKRARKSKHERVCSKSVTRPNLAQSKPLKKNLTYKRCMCCGHRKYISKDKVWCADCAQMLGVEV